MSSKHDATPQNHDGMQWVAVAIVPVFKGKVLSMRRAPGRSSAGVWETVSGKVRPFEEPRDAAARELREETGLVGEVCAIPSDAYLLARGDISMTVLVYRVDLERDDVRRTHEHDDHRWVPFDQVDDHPFPPRLTLAIARALRNESD